MCIPPKEIRSGVSITRKISIENGAKLSPPTPSLQRRITKTTPAANRLRVRWGIRRGPPARFCFSNPQKAPFPVVMDDVRSVLHPPLCASSLPGAISCHGLFKPGGKFEFVVFNFIFLFFIFSSSKPRVSCFFSKIKHAQGFF